MKRFPSHIIATREEQISTEKKLINDFNFIIFSIISFNSVIGHILNFYLFFLLTIDTVITVLEDVRTYEEENVFCTLTLIIRGGSSGALTVGKWWNLVKNPPSSLSLSFPLLVLFAFGMTFFWIVTGRKPNYLNFYIFYYLIAILPA